MTVPKINSAHGSETRNVINRAIETLNRLGIDVQTLVAEGQLTPSQYAELITVINGHLKSGEVDIDALNTTLRAEVDKISNKIDKGDVSVYDINKNKGKFDGTYFSSEFLSDLNNGEINATKILPRSVTGGGIADRAIRATHTDFLKSSSNLLDRSKETEFKNINSSGEIIDSSSYNISDFIPVNPGADYYILNAPAYTEWDVDGNFIKHDWTGNNGDNVITTSGDAAFIRLNIQRTHPTHGERRMNEGQDRGYEEYYTAFDGVDIHGTDLVNQSITESKLEDKTATARIRTNLGDHMPLLHGGQNGGYVDLTGGSSDLKLTFRGNMFAIFRDGNYRIDDGTEIELNNIISASRVILWHPETNDFRVTTSGAIRDVTANDEDYVVFAVAYTSGGSWHLTINTTDYKINGNPIYMPFRNVSEDDSALGNNLGFSTEKLIASISDSDFVGAGEEGNPFDIENDDHTFVYGLFDDLMDANPDYISREEIGRSTNDLPVYAYHFRPLRAVLDGSTGLKEYPKIIMDSSIHGGENLATHTLYFAFKRICEEWQDDEALHYLRHFINFAVVPLPNPEDFNTKSYDWGVDDINLNRDFDINWFSGPHTGDAPFTRVESRNMRDFLFDHDDALLFIDCHVRGQPVLDDRKTLWFATSYPENLSMLSTTIEQMSVKWKKKYPNVSHIDTTLGHMTSGVGRRTIRSYTEEVVGIKSLLWEGFKATPSITDREGKQVYDMNVDALLQLIINAVKFHQY